MFELANGGTLFIEEIGMMPASIQVMFLKTMMDKSIKRLGSEDAMPVDARIITSNNTELKDLVDDGTFRADLYHRLNVIKIDVKPLAQRRDDVLPIAVSILNDLAGAGNEPFKLDPEACSLIYSYEWPGNVKEMENVLKTALKSASDGVITKASLPKHIATLSIKTVPNTALQKLEAFKGRFLKAYLSAKVGKG
jgi:transcriptional regulator with PAS, ATPase and Fis domain